MLSYSGVYSFDASAREFDMKNTALFLVMGIIYALSSDMDYLDAEMMRRNSQDYIPALNGMVFTAKKMDALRL